VSAEQISASDLIGAVAFDAAGLVPAIAQDAKTGEVLMLAWMNRDALKRTLETGDVTYWSRSRKELWRKGATSGHTQRLVEAYVDCDGDTLLLKVEQVGPACHTGATSCFANVPPLPLEQLMLTLRDRHATRPAGSYAASLFDAGRDRILKKIGEEATEVIIAAKGEGRERMISEIADLVFHLSVLMVDEGIGWADVEGELEKRRR